ncbi:MAG TPA: hypothetical protein VH083_08730 [Myxococcales bacterium]|nr:hypothetical protein [Myxococcales bacterium]
MVVGSVATSLYGDPRLTNDIDFVVELTAARVATFSATLGDEFDVDQDALADAMRSGAGALNVLSPADSVLSKLSWFRDGGGVSDQQWRDVIGVLRVNEVDLADLRAWALRLGLQELLEKALRAARPG